MVNEKRVLNENTNLTSVAHPNFKSYPNTIHHLNDISMTIFNDNTNFNKNLN